MDTFDLNKAISCMDPAVYAECFPEEKNRKKADSAITKAVQLGVIRKD